MNGGSGQWKRLRSRMGHALGDDDEGRNKVIITKLEAVFIMLSIRRLSYARVHFGSSEQKSVSARWPPTRRPSYKLDL